jgi:hypothetical protein
MLTIAWLALTSSLTGCGSTVVRLEEAIPCPLSADKLAERCVDPQPVSDAATFGAIVSMAQADRHSLRSCARHDELLRETIAACNAAIDKHNEAIRAINSKYAGKP